MSDTVDTQFLQLAAFNPTGIESGMTANEITAAVNALAEPASEAEAGPDDGARLEALKAIVKLPDLTIQQLSKLALELAMNIRTVGAIVVDYSITVQQLDFLKSDHPLFKQMLDASTIEWNSAKNTQERLRIEAAAALEQALPALAARMSDPKESLNYAVEAGKMFSKIAGVDQPKDAGKNAPGERFQITINLGDTKEQTIKATKAIKDVTGASAEASGSAGEIQVIAEG